MKTLILVLSSFILATMIPASIEAKTFTVNTTDDLQDSATVDDLCDADTNTEGEQCSLRAAVQAANALAGADVIEFADCGSPPCIYMLSTTPATTGINENSSATGSLDIWEELTIKGAGVDITIIDGGIGTVTTPDRVFLVVAKVTMSGVTIQNGGSDQVFGGGIDVDRGGSLFLSKSKLKSNKAIDGGGIFVFTGRDATITEVEFVRNTATGAGGGIRTYDSKVQIFKSTFIANEATTGGGITNRGTMLITDSIVSQNLATIGSGGGIYNNNVLDIKRSLINENTSNNNGNFYAAGGIENFHGTLTLTNVTLSGNSTKSPGGGLTNIGTGIATLSSVTITQNKGDSDDSGIDNAGGGIYSDNTGITMFNTIIAGNTNGVDQASDCLGTIILLSNNIIQNSTGCTLVGGGTTHINIADSILKLEKTLTGDIGAHALLEGSVAIDAGGNAFCPETDQQGLVRPRTAEDPCDIGAYESGAAIVQFSAITDTVAENAGTKSISVDRTDGGNEGLIVAYSIADGTAKLDTDYSNASTSFKWADGETGAKTFDITIIDNDEEDGDKELTITLTSTEVGKKAKLGDNKTLTLTILDDEKPGGAFCDNGAVDDGEECDGDNLNDATCESVGSGPGTLSCTAECKFDKSACTTPGTSPPPGGGGGGGCSSLIKR